MGENIGFEMKNTVKLLHLPVISWENFHFSRSLYLTRNNLSPRQNLFPAPYFPSAWVPQRRGLQQRRPAACVSLNLPIWGATSNCNFFYYFYAVHFIFLHYSSYRFSLTLYSSIPELEKTDKLRENYRIYDTYNLLCVCMHNIADILW